MPATVSGSKIDGAPISTSANAGAESFRIHQGSCWVFFAFDVGYSIDLDAAQKMVSNSPARDEQDAQRDVISHRRREPSYLQFHPAPLRINQSVDPVFCDLRGFQVAPRVEATLYDFGAISIAYSIPLDGGSAGLPVEALIPLTESLANNEVLAADARERVRRLSQRFESGIKRPAIVDLVEDYTVYHVRQWSPETPAPVAVSRAAESVARLLLGEAGPLSPQAVEAALAAQLSYSPGDVAVIDWNAALLLDAQAEDALAVLEFANVELLEMRFIDDRLDSILDRSYVSLLRDSRKGIFSNGLRTLLDPHKAERRRLAALQMESAVLFEGINNTLKLVGDQHLARLYALAARRLHLQDWDQSVLRKLHTVDGLYQKLADEQSARRMEVLEWIIIFLIAVSIVLPFIVKGAK